MSRSLEQIIQLDHRLDRIRSSLQAYHDRSDTFLKEEWRSAVESIISVAVSSNDQELAKAGWCLRQIGGIQDAYVSAFLEMRSGEFYSAWRFLARCDGAIRAMDRHFRDESDTMGLAFIRKHVEQFQQWYPYGMFISPEILVSDRLCSICRTRFAPRSGCDHRIGEIYDGRYCHGVVVSAKAVGISFVTEPDFKANVVFLIDDETGETFDHFDYRTVEYIVRRLRSPWSPWGFSVSDRVQPLERFAGLRDDSPCPCDSGMNFEQCCRARGGVVRPHVDFIFSDPIPPELQFETYLDDPEEGTPGVRNGRRYRPFHAGGMVLEAPTETDISV